VPINGVRQGLVIRSSNAANPVLLWVHGGPGMPDYPLTQQHPTGLEDLFTIVWWDQRGAALSFNTDIPPETMTIEQFIADTLAVTDYLRDLFHQDRIYILGHSWGSFIALQAAARWPERYRAYLGMAQMVHQLESEEKINLWRGRAFSRRFGLWDQFIRIDLRETVPALGIPVYFLEGRFDYTCVTSLARGYLEQLQAPVKGFYLFRNSAHSPLLEEPRKAHRILERDVLAGANILADLRWPPGG